MVNSNNSIIPIAEVGEDGNALQCVTDRNPCCDSSKGQWFFPGGSNQVSDQRQDNSIYQSFNSNGIVALNGNGNIMTPAGLYCCVVLDAINVNQTLCPNLGEEEILIYIHIYITIILTDNISCWY